MSDPESRAGFIAPQRPIAHRRPDDDATHDLEEHLCATARLAAAFAGRWGASEAAALSGLWHDLGKYAPDFQTMIRSADPQAHLEGVPGGPRRRIDHSSAGALLALERFGDGARWGLKDRLANKSHLARARSGQPPATILNY